ncbi:MAG: GNAT family N-acetyltransferase, partial [Desulfocucumaceae bacterium]
MYTLVEIKNENKSAFKKFEGSFYEEYFEKLGNDQSICGAGATFFGDPVGLALCHKYYENDWNVIFVYVVPKFRNMG